jgi:pilus assembly protein CpaF
MALKDLITGRDGLDHGPSGTLGDDLVIRYRRQLLDELNLDELMRLDPKQRRARLERVVGRLLTRDGPILSVIERQSVIRRVVDEALGLGVLEPLLADPDITEIMVNGPSSIYVERYGRIEAVDARFASEAQLYQTIDRIVAQVNRRVDESSPMVDARLPTGERVHVIIPPLTLTGPTLTIRRFPRSYTLDELAGMGSLDEPTAQLLRVAVAARCNILVSGGTATGKTTLLNALSGSIGARERIITIEDAAELQLQQPHVVGLEARPPSVEGTGQVSIRDLVRNSLRMRPDRIVIGEVRGAETLDMLQAMNTGHEGSLTTVHANSAEDAIMRLETLALMTELNLPPLAIREQIGSALDLIVHLERWHDGSRRVSHVVAVAGHTWPTASLLEAGHHRGHIELTPVTAFSHERLEPTRPVRGHFTHRTLPPRLGMRIHLSGRDVPGEFLAPADGPTNHDHGTEA